MRRIRFSTSLLGRQCFLVVGKLACVCVSWLGFCVYHCTKQEMPDASELTIESFAEFMRNSGHVLEQLEESLAATQAQHKVVAARGQ